MIANEYPVQKHVTGQREYRRVHDRLGVTDALRRESQRQEDEHPGCPERDHLYVTDRHVAKGDIDTDGRQRRRGEEPGEQHDRDGEEDAEVNALARIAPDQRHVAGAVVTRGDGRDGHQHSEHQRKPHEPDAAAYRYSRQRFGSEPACHHGVGEVHACDRQIIDDQRPRDAQ
jgi:hypothetical protein